MKKLLLILILIIPFNVKAVDVDVFYGSTCPYCHNELEYLKTVEKQYQKNIDINKYEVWHNKKNNAYMNKVKKKLNITADGVPLTVIDGKSVSGFNEKTTTKITNLIDNKLKSQDTLYFPIIGKINVKTMPILIQVIILSILSIFSLNSLWLILFTISIIMFSKKNISFLIGMAASYILIVLNIIKLNSFMLMVIETILTIVPLTIGALILNNYMNKKEIKIGTIPLFILGFISSFILYNIGLSHLLDISLSINNKSIIYLILYTIIYSLLIFILSKIITKTIKTKKEIISFIILILISISLAFLPSFYIF